MNITQLEYLVATIDKGSFANAAKSLYISPQAVSKAVSDLEKELSLNLFARSGRGIIPTSHGVLLSVKANEIIQNCEDLRTYATSLSSDSFDEKLTSGTLNLAVASSPYEGGTVPKKFFKKFIKDYPRINLSLNYSSSGSCLSALQEKVIDSAIILGRYSSSHLTCKKLFDSILHIAVAKTHPLSQHSHVTLTDLAPFPVIKPHDIRYCLPLIEKSIEEVETGIHLLEISPSPSEYHRFLHEQNGAVFVIYDPTLEEVYPEVKLIPVNKKRHIKIPICLVYSESADKHAATLLQRALVKATQANT